MKIQFCDLCNESVPESDLATGKAVTRKGRVICSTCEELMTGERESKSSAEPVEEQVDKALAGLRDLAPPSPPTPRQRQTGGSPGAVIAFLALVVACGGAWFFWDQLEVLRGEESSRTRKFNSRLQAASLDLDDLSRRSQERRAALELRLRQEYAGELNAARQEVAQMRAEAETALGAQQTLEAELRDEMEALVNSERDIGERLDELMARTIKSREEYALLMDRLVEAETAIASGAAAPPPTVEAIPSAPEWAGELADLTSDNAGKRWNAVQALGDTGDPAVVPHLVPMISDTDIFVRMAVARVFGDLGAPEAIDALITALEDEEAVVREAAMVSLHAITGRNFRFDPMAGAAARAKKVKEWRQWWGKARSEYLGGA